MEEARTGLEALALDDALQNSPLRKLPAELRLKIFGLALRVDDGVIHLGPIENKRLRTKLEEKRVNVALFTVCRKVASEAQDAFCAGNTVRYRCYSTSGHFLDRDRVRHLAFSRGSAFGLRRHYIAADALVADALVAILDSTARNFPKLRSITVPCEELGRDQGKTVRTLLKPDQTEVIIRCITLGKFEVTSKREPFVNKSGGVVRAYFDLPALREVLPLSKEYTVKYRVSVIRELLRSYPWSSFESEILLNAHFLSAYDIWRAKLNGDSTAYDQLSSDEQRAVREIVWPDIESICSSTTVPCISPLLPTDMKLIDVIGSKQLLSSALLEWATELLAMNLAIGYERRIVAAEW